MVGIAAVCGHTFKPHTKEHNVLSFGITVIGAAQVVLPSLNSGQEHHSPPFLLMRLLQSTTTETATK
jgi:hypothetical protein